MAPRKSLWKLHLDLISIFKSTISVEKNAFHFSPTPLQLTRIDRLSHKKHLVLLRLCFSGGICFWLLYENDWIFCRNWAATHLCMCCNCKLGGQSRPMDMRMWTRGEQLASELPLLQQDCRCQWLYSHGTGFWVQVQHFPACISLIVTCCAWWWLSWSLLLLPEYLRKLGALKTYEASPRTASHTPYLSWGEGAWENTMAFGFIGCEEHERFILGFLCSLCEYFFTAALSPSWLFSRVGLPLGVR